MMGLEELEGTTVELLGRLRVEDEEAAGYKL
jgi:hypothetical protein